MSLRIFQMLVLIAAVLAAGQADAQIFDASTPSGRPRAEEELPKKARESLARQQMDRERKKHDELIKRTEEANALSLELKESLDGSRPLTADELKKVERLERLVKRIRDDLGGGDDDEKSESPSSLNGALKMLQQGTTRLLSEIRDSTRFSVSAASITSSNAVLRLLRFIRSGK